MNTPQSQVEPGLNARRVLLFLAGYFTLHLLLRLLISHSAELDEAEQLLLAQDLRLGYGPQPPLYTWLLAGAFHLFGMNLLALAVLKNCLLFLTCLFVYFSAKEVTQDRSRAITATLSLLLIPQIFWESQRDLTHSVLGTTVAACSLFVMLRLLKTGSLRYYLLFGLCAGLGILSKYNYAIFLLALLLAAASLGDLRSRLFHRKFVLSLICLLLIITPHLYWVSTHLQATLAQTGKFQTQHAPGLWTAYALGLWSLIRTVLLFLGLLVPVYLLFFFRKGKSGMTTSAANPYPALVQRALLAGIVLCVLMILCFKVTVFKDRWMQPLLFFSPIVLVSLPWFQHDPALARRYSRFALGMALGVLVILPGRTLLAAQLGKYNRLNAPYSALAGQLRTVGFQRGVIIANDRLVGGNLKLFFSESLTVSPDVPPFPAPPEADRLIVWDATKAPELPQNLRQFAERFTSSGICDTSPQYLQALYQHSKDRQMRLGFLLLRKQVP